MKREGTGLRTLFIVLSVITVLSVSIGGYLFYSSLTRLSTEQAHKEAAEKLSILRNDVDSFLTWALISVKSLAGLREMKQALLKNDPDRIHEANIILDHFKDSLGVSVCYLMNPAGDTIASSNRDTINSFVGKNYGFRPYFTQSMQGIPAVYMALGITSQERGVYYSHPVYSKDRQVPAGVVVIKAPADLIEKKLMDVRPGIMLLTDPRSIIFFSSRTEWLYHLLWEISPGMIQDIEKSNQFGTGPWKWTGMKQINPDVAEDDQGNLYRHQQQELVTYPGWKLVSLISDASLMEKTASPLNTWAGKGIIALCVMLGGTVCLLFIKANSSLARQKKMEQAVAESEEKYRVLFDTFPLGITVSDPAGKIVETNDTAVRLLGIPRKAHESRRVDGNEWRIIQPDGSLMPPEKYASVRALKENRRIENVEMGIVNPDGDITWISVTAAPLSLEKYGVVVTYGDITARKRVEQEYLTLFREMMDGFALHEIICDNKGQPIDYRFLAVNPAFEKMTGLKAEAIIGKTVLEMMPDTERHWIETYGNVALTGESVVFENFSVTLGKTFEVTSFRPKPGRFACIFADITERKQAEAERDNLQAQLLHAQKMESVGRLAGGVAHDFNNMLGVILGHTEMALDTIPDTHPLHEDLMEIQRAAQRSANLTRQLLTFARKQIIEPKMLDLNQTIESMLTMLHRLIGENIELVWKPAKTLWHVKMDPSQIDQILANLCVNARDAINGSGNIIIETGIKILNPEDCHTSPEMIPGEFVLLSVTDNGCGMDPKTLDNLFEPFFTTKDVGKGTGLGLATIYGIVKQNSGFIHVDSETGQGARFRIYLPRYRPPAEETAAGPLKTPAPGGSETILLVEDEPTILKMTRLMLERKGYRVLAVDTPGEALACAKNHDGRIHLLMTDIIMPEMNGWNLAGHLSALYPDMKRLFMSGYTADVIAHQGVLDEGIEFIQKPFSMTDLAARIRQVLG